jgi:hypothetical protein
MWSKPPLYLPTKLQKIIEKTKHFLDYFLTRTVPLLLKHSSQNTTRVTIELLLCDNLFKQVLVSFIILLLRFLFNFKLVIVFH